MAIVFYKVVALGLKVFSKPFIDRTKKIHLSRDAKLTNPFFRGFFVYLGNRFNYLQQWINLKFLKIQTNYAYKPLNDELAVEKGINIFYEFLLYFIILGAAFYELVRSSNQSKQKSANLQKTLKKVEARLKFIKQQIKQQNILLEKQRTVVHPMLKFDGTKTSDSKYKLNIRFQTKKLHVYHLDTLI